eukprot:XP_001689570.1 predicted protein [Chlamydomonas reinhardtii]
MGRLPKGFKKSAGKPHEVEDEAAPAAAPEHEHAKEEAAKPAHAPAPAAPAPSKPAAKAEEHAAHSDSDDDSDDGGEKGPETRGKMLQRHKKEMAAHKKVVQKLGSKKKDEAAKLTAEMEARHARELKELDAREKAAAAAPAAATPAAVAAGAGAAAEADGAAEALDGLALGGGHKAERQARIAEELAALGPSDKALEEERLADLLAPLGLAIREIRADGHCMYRAVEDQLGQAGGAASAPDHLALRKLAAAHIRAHADDFLPFIFDEDEKGEPAEQLEAYCEELESTAVWGGQLELGALAAALRRQIKVHALGMPTVTLGDEHAASGGPPLQLCYLRHAFGLGEHYNSVSPLAKAPADSEDATGAAPPATS